MSQVITFDSEAALERALNEAAGLPARWGIVAKGGKFTAIALEGEIVISSRFNSIVNSGSDTIQILAIDNIEPFVNGMVINVHSDDELYNDSGTVTANNGQVINVSNPYIGNAGAGTITEIP